MKIVVFSDPHRGKDISVFKPERTDIWGNEFSSLFNKILKREKDFDLLVCLGDLIADKSPSEDFKSYTEVISFLKKIKAECLFVVGNHDCKNLSHSDLSKLINRKRTYYSVDIMGVKHIVLSANWVDKKGYTLLEDELNWLDEELKNSNVPCIIYSHYPFDNQNLKKSKYFSKEIDVFLREREDVQRLVGKYSTKIRLIVFGHVHQYNKGKIKGVSTFTVPSMTEDNGGKPSGEYAVIDTDKEFSLNIYRV